MKELCYCALLTTSSSLREFQASLILEQGFHQCDVNAVLDGLVESHPLQIFASLHHFDRFRPLFIGMNISKSLDHLSKSLALDPSGFLQQSICHDLWVSFPLEYNLSYDSCSVTTCRKGGNWTLSLSWGFSAIFYNKVGFDIDQYYFAHGS